MKSSTLNILRVDDPTRQAGKKCDRFTHFFLIFFLCLFGVSAASTAVGQPALFFREIRDLADALLDSLLDSLREQAMLAIAPLFCCWYF